MRLADFILGNIESIIVEWKAFARSVWPKGEIGPLALRDHAEELLRAAAADMLSGQTDTQQSDKSKGRGAAGQDSARVDEASEVHGAARVRSGFDLVAVVSEYRALRASVIRLWRESGPVPDLHDLDDLTRFNESIDQSLTQAVQSYTEKIDRSRQMFLSILGHDLRNPLQSMMMSADALSQAGRLDAESSREASHISASAVAMGRMIGDLLDFTIRGVGAAMPLSPAPMELGRLCREVFDEMRAAHPTNMLRFEAQGNLTGEWDANRLRQLVSNLLGNAVQHGLESGPVDLTVSAEDVNNENVLLVVHNWGPPIPRDALATIFDPLVRGSSPQAQKKRRPGSIGLGLYIAHEVVIAHGGSIDVTSSAEAGTVFTVRLPRHRAPAPAAGPAPSEESR